MLTRDDIETALELMDKQGLIRLAHTYNSTSKWRQLHCPFHNNGQERRPSCGCSLEEQVMNGKVYILPYIINAKINSIHTLLNTRTA